MQQLKPIKQSIRLMYIQQKHFITMSNGTVDVIADRWMMLSTLSSIWCRIFSSVTSSHWYLYVNKPCWLPIISCLFTWKLISKVHYVWAEAVFSVLCLILMKGMLCIFNYIEFSEWASLNVKDPGGGLRVWKGNVIRSIYIFKRVPSEFRNVQSWPFSYNF